MSVLHSTIHRFGSRVQGRHLFGSDETKTQKVVGEGRSVSCCDRKHENSPRCGPNYHHETLGRYLMKDPSGLLLYYYCNLHTNPNTIPIHFHHVIQTITIDILLTYNMCRSCTPIFSIPSHFTQIIASGILVTLSSSSSIFPLRFRWQSPTRTIFNDPFYISTVNLITLLKPSFTLNLFANLTASYQLTFSTGQSFPQLPK